MIRDDKVRSQLEDYEKMKKKVEQLQNLNKFLAGENKKLKIEADDMKSRYKETPACQENVSNQRERIASLLAANQTLSDKYKQYKAESIKARNDYFTVRGKYTAMKNLYDNIVESLELIEQAVTQVKAQMTEVYTVPQEEHVADASTTHTAEQEREQQPQSWHCYLQELVCVYQRTGKLTGISTLATKYHVRAITNEMFFQLGMSGMQKVTIKDADNIAEKIRNAKY